MTDISDLEGRIARALERIEAGMTAQAAAMVEAVAAAADAAPAEADASAGGHDDDGETPGFGPGALAAAEARIAELTETLEGERSTNAQLEARVVRIREQLQTKVQELTEAKAKQAAAAAARPETAVDAQTGRDRALADLQAAAEGLRASNAELRDANAKGLTDARLINESLLVELEALRAARAADVAEANTLLAALEPIVAREAKDA
ncbi:MAG: hypothetical protein ACU0CO_16620 [Shimia sp.]